MAILNKVFFYWTVDILEIKINNYDSFLNTHVS